MHAETTPIFYDSKLQKTQLTDQNRFEQLYNPHDLNLILAKQNLYDIHFVISIQDYQETSHFDVCFCAVGKSNINDFLYMQGIGTQKHSLLVAINIKSCFVFALNDATKYPSYVAEKLNISSGDTGVAEQIADIINTIQNQVNQTINN